MLIGSAAVTNARRILHFQEAINDSDKPEKMINNRRKCSQGLPGVSFFVLARAIFTDWINLVRSPKLCLGC